MNRVRYLWAFCSVALLFAGAGQAPSQRSSNQQSGPQKDNVSAAEKYFTDVALINQKGEQMRLYSDLLKGKVVIINSFFTSCPSVCPPMTANLAKVQEWLGDRLGKDVHLISISVDPATDTPPRLREYAERFKAKDGWHFLTGQKANLDLALTKLGQYVNNRDDHLTVIIIGNERTGLWKKAFGLARPEELIKVVESVLSDPGAPPEKLRS